MLFLPSLVLFLLLFLVLTLPLILFKRAAIAGKYLGRALTLAWILVLVEILSSVDTQEGAKSL